MHTKEDTFKPRKQALAAFGTLCSLLTCAYFKALCVFMVLYQSENSCHSHCSNLDTSSDYLVENSNTITI